jgi:uncharacterized Zn finger protein (UPF0148 family)
MDSLVETQKKVIKKIKSTKHWHHDIQYINGQFVEEVVKEFQRTNCEDLLTKIIDNYSIFRGEWAKAFAQYLDGDVDAGSLMHDEIVWRSAFKFKREKSRKPDGKAFNAYVVSALLNQLKNQRNARMSHKNHPRVVCPVCNEEVYQIDHKHLRHSIDLERYKKALPAYPLVSAGGMTLCPTHEAEVKEINQAYLNRITGNYTLEDYRFEHGSKTIRCPVSGSELRRVDNAYPSSLMSGYTAEDFLVDFPNFVGAVTCPFTGKRVLEINQRHLDAVVNKNGMKNVPSLEDLVESLPNLTLSVRQVPVTNPYTGKKVLEITLPMLASAGTTWKDHMEAYAGFWLDKEYPEGVRCPFTGRKTTIIRQEDLKSLGKTVSEFYAAVSKYPLQKFQVRLATTGEWVDNVWDALEASGASLDEYRETFPKHPLASYDGTVPCPVTGKPVEEITEAYLNRIGGRYTVSDFEAERETLERIVCPVSKMVVKKVDNAYPGSVMQGYSPEEFLADFPNFRGAITCPFTGKKLLEMTQSHLDAVVNAGKKTPVSMAEMTAKYPNYTFQAMKVPVTNPYTGKKVSEITLSMLAAAGTTWKEHMEKYSEIWLDKYYPGMVVCPFTGRKTHMIKKTDVEGLGKTVWDFYAAVCRYPLRKYQVRCGLCGEWTDNIWSHLEQKAHSFAKSMTINEFESIYGTYATKVVVRTNSYVENDAGDSIHVADLFPDEGEKIDFLELEDSLLGVAHDDLDRKIAHSIRGASTVEDIFYSAAEIRSVKIPFEFKSGMTKAARDAVKDVIGEADFDLALAPVEGSCEVSIMIPSRDTIRRKLTRMIESSDLAKI